MSTLATLLLVAAAVLEVIARRRRRATLPPQAWPRLIDEVDARVRRGHAPPAAVLEVALHGPPVLRAAAAPARQVWRATGDPAAALRALARRAADPDVDRLCDAALLAHVLDTDAVVALRGLRAVAPITAAHGRQLARSGAAGRAAARVALAPLAAVAAGQVTAVAAWLAVGAAIVAVPVGLLAVRVPDAGTAGARS